MARRFDLARRVEAVYTLDRPQVAWQAMRAEVHDPAWFLARQWQLGEHAGSDAASPTVVTVTLTEVPVRHARPGPEFDPAVTPPEVVIEAEPEQWWTPGRRVRIGQALQARVPAAPELLFAGLAAPYDRLNGRGLDGLAVFRARAALGLADSVFADLDVPLDEPDDDWQPDTLHYAAHFSAGAAEITIPRHDGGDVDWYSVTAAGSPGAAGATSDHVTHPTRVSFPGAPAPRWWQLEDHRVDAGAVAPQRTQLSALLMIHATAVVRDDWFTAPLVLPTGALAQISSVTVRDAMDLLSTAAPVQDWSLFRITGLGPDHLLTWPTVAGPVVAPASLDEVLLGIDEDANMVWAIENRVDGADTFVPPTTTAPGSPEIPRGHIPANGPISYTYLPSTTVAPFWHPYVLQTRDGRRVYVQARQADLTSRPIAPEPGPSSRLLHTPSALPGEAAHTLDPAAIPPLGIRLDRRYALGRRTDGKPVLWVQRRTTALHAPPVSGLVYDVLVAEPAAT